MTTIQSAAQQTTPNSASGQANQQLSVDYENFLKLLTAQISNQDPLAPMESTEFVSQLAQLSQVEQSIQTNSNLEAISASLAANSAKSDIGLLGREILIVSDQVQLAESGTKMGYRLTESADLAVVTIRDGFGTVVRRITSLPGGQGELQEVTWDGLTDDGDQAALGLYEFSVTGYGNDGVQYPAETLAFARVDGITLDGLQSTLKLDNGVELRADSIVEVR